MSDKDQAKLEKKKKKAEYKLEKKRAKEEVRGPEVRSPGSKNQEPRTREPVEEAGGGRREAKEAMHKDPEKTTIKVILPKEKPVVWYKNPSWIRAIASVVVMIVVILTFYLTYG